MKCFRVREKLRLAILAALLVCAGAWPCFAATETVLDTFSVISYANQNGTANWSADWVEVGDNNSPNDGIFSLNLGALQIERTGWGASSAQITRGLDLSQAIGAVLSFDCSDFSTDGWFGSAEIRVLVSANGGTSWQDLGSVNSVGSRSFNMSGYMSANTLVRFSAEWQGLWSSVQVAIDNVQVEYEIEDIPGLVAHFALEGNVTDSSGKGHHGSRQGTVTYQPAKVCEGVQLDGGGYLRVPDHADLDRRDELTVMAWIYADNLSVSGHDNYYSILSKDTNYEFHVESDLTRQNGYLYWWWSNGSFRTQSPEVKLNTWTHVAFVYSRTEGRMRIFVDGKNKNQDSYAYSGQLPVNTDSLYIGTDKTTGGGEMPQRRFFGSIDEVRIYNRALSAGEITGLMNETNPCGAGIDHYEIVHDGSALTCSPEAVTIRACVDADCTSLYTNDVDIDLSPAGWVGGDRQTLSGGSGVFRLRHTTPGTVTLSVSSQDPAADSGPQCVDGAGGPSCNLTFHEAGFIFDVPDLTSCGLEENILIAAVRADASGERCVGDDSFADTTRNVNFWYSYQEPATGTLAVQVNGGTVSGASPGTAVQLTFNGQAQSLLNVRYADAGRVGLSARFDGSGEEVGLVMTGSDSFVASPHHLLVRASTGGTPLNNATSGGDPLWPAGEDFTVEVTGVCSDDSVTPNFAAITALNATAANPAPGSFTGGSLVAGDFSGGTATGTAAYSEVGTVTLQAEAANYLGSGRNVTGTTVVGRFTPHHFDVSLNSPSFATACGLGGFTYVGQPFMYGTDPVISVTARNKQNEITLNYTGEWWRITGANLTGKTYSTATGALDLSSIPAADPVISDLGGGMGMLTFGDGGGLRFVRNAAPVASFDAEISLSINVLDGDGIAPTTNPVTFGEASAGNGIPFASGKNMRWGRLALQNAYGSEQVALPMPFRAEFFNGSAFVPNAADICTGVAASLLSLDNGSVTVTADNSIPVGGGTSTASLLNPFVSGAAGLEFSAPGSEGFIDVLADLSSLPWLLFDWKGVGPEGPTARATFGIYKSRPGIIYRRETYR
jgi:MSHA biogenesis protein MshQ